MRLFLSATTNPHKELRQSIALKLQKANYHVVVHDHFAEIGVNTLVKLAVFIERESDIVLHLLGPKVGSLPTDDEIAGLLEHCGEDKLRQRFPKLFEGDTFRRVTYTQWEAWLGWFYGKRVLPFEADEALPAVTTGTASIAPIPTAEHVEIVKGRSGWPTPFTDEASLLHEIHTSLARLRNQQTTDGRVPFHLSYSSLGEMFIGRKDFLKTLLEKCESARRAGRYAKHVVCGVGGLGKTRVAVEYALRYRHDYTAVLMVNGDSPESLRAGLAQLANVFDPNLDPATKDDVREKMTLDWLHRQHDWLLLVDNVDTPDARDEVVKRLSQWTNGHVLVTARIGEWPKLVETFNLEVLSECDGADFLLKATEGHRLAASDDSQQAKQLAHADLDGLCLALEQAAAYISKRAISLADYRHRWAENQKEARTWADNKLMQYHSDQKEAISVATTWLTTFDKLSAEAKTLLQMFAWLSPDPIPQGLADHPKLTEQWQTLTGNSTADIELALAELRSYSFLSRRSDSTSVGQVHRVVQLITRDRLDQQARMATLQAMLEAIDACVPAEMYDVRAWPTMEPLVPHVNAMITLAEASGISSPTTRLMNQLAQFLKGKALYKEAEPLMRRALAIDEEAYGAEHPNVAIRLNNLAILLQATNRLGEAEPLMRRALVIDEKAYGAEHPRVATRVNNLALLLQDTNRMGEAEPLMRRALAIDKKAYGADHPNVARDLNNLAQLLMGTNRLTEAEPLMRRAMAICEKSYGAEHPRVAINLNNLAQLLKAANRLGEAEPLMRRALVIDEKSYGAEHPDVAIDLSNLALLLQDTNRLGEAEPLMSRAVLIIAAFEQSTGHQHPSQRTYIGNYASILKAMGRSDAEIETTIQQLFEETNEE